MVRRTVAVLMLVLCVWAAPTVAAPAVAQVDVAQQESQQEVAQTTVEGPAAQRTTDDGTQIYQLIAAALFMLAGLMLILAWGYWKVTTPTARRLRR